MIGFASQGRAGRQPSATLPITSQADMAANPTHSAQRFWKFSGLLSHPPAVGQVQLTAPCVPAHSALGLAEELLPLRVVERPHQLAGQRELLALEDVARVLVQPQLDDVLSSEVGTVPVNARDS